MAETLLRRARDFLVLLFVLVTLLFVLLPYAGDPAQVLAGPDATLEQVEEIRVRHGLDRPLLVRYVSYWVDVLQLDFGKSMTTGEPAMSVVLSYFPATLLLTVLAMTVTIMVSIPLGAWLGSRPDRPSRRLGAAAVFLLQGAPGFVVALVLIQLFSVNLAWLPSIGYESPDAWILPSLALASFLVPKLTRVVASGVSEALREDFVRTARAYGATATEILYRHVLPNALLGAAALIGTQFVFLLSGAVLIERIFSWPGLGWLLIERTQDLDYPVVQALVMFVAFIVFVVNALTDLSFRILDPRVRAAGR